MNQYNTNEDFRKEVESCLTPRPDSYSPAWIGFLLYGKHIAEHGRLKWITHYSPEDEYSGQCYSIISLDGVLYKVVYAYQSHYGYELDYFNFYKVVPKEVVVTVYEPE